MLFKFNVKLLLLRLRTEIPMPLVTDANSLNTQTGDSAMCNHIHTGQLAVRSEPRSTEMEIQGHTDTTVCLHVERERGDGGLI
jgi:hypothetical protein